MMGQLAAALQQPQTAALVEKAVQQAAVTPDSMLSQTGMVFTKTFYQQLGADTDAMQTSLSGMWASKMLGLTLLLLTACAIGAGLPGAAGRRGRAGPAAGRVPSGDLFQTARWTSFPARA